MPNWTDDNGVSHFNDELKAKAAANRTRSRKTMHSANTPEWGTPGKFAGAARATMGSITLDPASCARANATIQAGTYYDAQQDGLDPLNRWSGNVFLNPPGGLVREFWARLLREWQVGNIEQAVWIGYSLQQLQQLQLVCDGAVTPLDFPICFPKRRIAFDPIAGQPAAAPGHANYIAYLPNKHHPELVTAFVTAFQDFGRVLVNGWDP